MIQISERHVFNLALFCVAFETENRMSCPFVSEGVQHNQGTLSVKLRVCSTTEVHYQYNLGVQ